jgi:membrane protease subunit HflK
MGWNEPPGGRGRDPWGSRGNGDGPPDLEDLVRRLQQGFGGLFGRRPVGVGGSGSSMLWLLAFLIVFVLMLIDMTYFVDQQERGVVMRFGRYIKTLQPGLNIQYPGFIDDVVRINVGQVRSITHKATMLTQDENIVDVEVAVQWRIDEPADYVFNVLDPAATLRQVAESAVRQVIGKSKLDFVLTEGRSEIAQRQQEAMQEILRDYKTGIWVATVEMQPAKPPEQVKAAFDDAIKAREDEQRLVNEAEAYRNEIIPQARGEAARMRQEAEGYKASVVARAEGEAARFDQLLAEYERAPAVTRQRLYLDAMESVLSRTGKVLLDTQHGNSLMYLPLDKILEQSGTMRGITLPPAYGGNARSQPQGTENQPNERARPSR